MLQWNAGYDPVVEPVGGKLFVDDLAAMNVGPRRALRTQFFLVIAGGAAGLLIGVHTCAFTVVRGMHPAARRALRRIRVTEEWHGEECVLTGMPPHVVDAVARYAAGGQWGLVHEVRNECRCQVKTGVIPSWGVEA